MGTPLAEALAAGDREAFAALYDRLGQRLFATARTMLASTADAEDVVHDLFVELARLRHRLAAIERRLERNAAGAPAPDLRHRVLLAVDDALAERRPRAAAPAAPERSTFRPLDVRRLLEENL